MNGFGEKAGDSLLGDAMAQNVFNLLHVIVTGDAT